MQTKNPPFKKQRISTCRKSLFFQKSACSQSLSPNPFPVGRGYITGATAPSPCRGLRPCDPIFINDRGFSTVCNAHHKGGRTGCRNTSCKYLKWGRRGEDPVQVVSHLCHCIVQWLCVADYKRPCLVRAVAPHSAPARTPGVYAQRLCKDAKPTKHTQPFTGKGVWGFGKDAEIERPKALQDAKPTKRSYGD